MKKLGAPMVALAAAAAMLVTGCAKASNTTRSSGELGLQRKTRVGKVANSQQRQASLHPEADDDFGDADAYYNLHPEGGK